MKIKLIVLILILSAVLAACGGAANSPLESSLGDGESAADAEAQPVEDKAMTSMEFSGTVWVLADLNGAKALAADEGGQPATLQYDLETGKLVGSTGCNQYFAEAEVDLEAQTIAIGTLGMTRMACRGPVADQEIAFTTLLGKAARYEIDGSQLTLLADDGDRMVFGASGE